jgi:hypothetical protein
MLILSGAAILVFFGYYERHAAVPLIPPRLLKNRTILSGSAIGFFHFCSQFCYESFFTSFLQCVPLSLTVEGEDRWADMRLIGRQGRSWPFASGRVLHQVSSAIAEVYLRDSPLTRTLARAANPTSFPPASRPLSPVTSPRSRNATNGSGSRASWSTLSESGS